jgi:hypothetical protein
MQHRKARVWRTRRPPKAPHCQNVAIGTIRAVCTRGCCPKLSNAGCGKDGRVRRRRASEILRHLGCCLPYATLEYEHMVGIHKFVISRTSLIYSLIVPDWLLQTTPLEELKRTIAPVIDRILLGVAPHRISIGVWAAHAAV